MTTEIRADLSANVWKIVVTEGQVVAEDDALMILESMKMEIPVYAPSTGTVVTLAVKEGELVEENALLVVLDA
ncbi:Biotin-requiring enzyme [Agreia bicolorata]|uniref:Biotin-requiring enzyme n=1 Tax=Agreia bicolorata TaxID=110935 RepID=A0A1T4WQ24_9MICO|nr:biotin/lipoyl-binding carrier protein [Agreia bicolorata]SKA79426.1 Biotin-requiring enzyme [Agreia bicolorata]